MSYLNQNMDFEKFLSLRTTIFPFTYIIDFGSIWMNVILKDKGIHIDKVNVSNTKRIIKKGEYNDCRNIEGARRETRVVR